MNAALTQTILAQVSEQDIVRMCCDVIDIPSPTGSELEMGRYMRAAFEAAELSVTWQQVEDGRPNVIGVWEGSGNGKRLMFNGHMDTSNTGEEKFLTGIGYKPRAVVRDGVIFGLGIYNMKGALICYLQAVKALQRAGLRLKGDVILGAVAGEIEKTQWGEEYTGKEYRGYGAGTHYLVNHGIIPDMCILGEPTDMKLVLGHFGSLWVRISTAGIYVHSAFSEGRESEHSVLRMRKVLDDIVAWIPCWEKKGRYGGRKALVNIGGIRGGHAWRASRTPERTDVYLDMRVPPTIPFQEARREVKNFVMELQSRYPEYGIEFETYVSVPGAEIGEDHEMVKAIEACHQQVTGRLPERDTVLWCSDASVLTRFDVPAVNYGPSSGPRDEQGEKVTIETLVNMTRIYALVAAQICSVEE